MTPFLKVAHVRLNPVRQGVEVDFGIVHQVGDHGWDIRRRRSSTNVLSIATPASAGIVGIDAAGSNLSSDGCHIITPDKVRD